MNSGTALILVMVSEQLVLRGPPGRLKWQTKEAEPASESCVLVSSRRWTGKKEKRKLFWNITHHRQSPIELNQW